MEKKLQRNEQDKMIAGVCSGLSEHFDIDVTWIRIAFVLAVMLGASGILAYIILWIVVPKKPYLPNYGQFATYDNFSPEPKPSINLSEKKKKKGNFRLFAGLIFIFFGLFFLLHELNLIPNWFDIDDLWPLILIGMGVYILSSGVKKNQKIADETEENDLKEEVNKVVESEGDESNDLNAGDKEEK